MIKKTLFIIVFLTLLIQNASASHITDLKRVGDQTELPSFTGSYAHPEASRERGAQSIASSILFVVDFLKYLLGSIAVLTIVISAAKMISSGVFAGSAGNEEEVTKQKNTIIFASIGLIMIIVADTVVNEIVYGGRGYEGSALQDIETAISYAYTGASHVSGFYNFLQFFVAAVAMLIVIYNGVRLIVESYNEETLAARKKHIGYALVALMIVGLSELFVKDIIFPVNPDSYDAVITTDDGITTIQEPRINEELALQNVANIGNFIVSFVAYLSMAALVYGGYLYITARGEEEQVGTAKKVFYGAIIGILLAAGAYALIATIIPLEGRTEESTEVTFDLP